jgi:hypothetical protein
VGPRRLRIPNKRSPPSAGELQAADLASSRSLPDGTELPPTGKRVEIRGMEYVQVRDGKIVIDNLYYDNVALLAQLGLVPPGATA